ncbi:16S rRNA (guanine(527)-N(7))-methyltransferase RsmG [Candidatus Gracilibacteria bacterium]|nr:16S rRNA (guanine(527)-N(7))-methyltransferase RsmG [Candidatus Gracilibacteria bacterium]
MSLESLFLTHGFELKETEIQQFEKFLSLFMEYNAHTNLSAIRDEEGIMLKHFIDSLYGVEAINSIQPSNHQAIRLLDIGSGGGFPGIPLKIVLPELQITLLDSVGKKVKAMSHFIRELGLVGIESIQERAEMLAKNSLYTEQYDFVVSRATAYITDILTWSIPFLAPGGRIVLYKMPSDEEEKDREKITKKLGLILEGELSYELVEKSRILLIFRKK